jgi:hypothetical protein
LLQQAKSNLTGDARDLWVGSLRTIHGQENALRELLPKLAGRADAERAAKEALEATSRFAAWVEEQSPKKTAPSGVGVENYDWYLKRVKLLPYTWAEEVTLMERELARSWASLALEEQRNRGLPELQPVASAEEHGQRFNAGVDDYVKFLAEREVAPVDELYAPALRAEIGRYHPGPREFFTEIDYRAPILMRTHGWHWIDLATMRAHPHPDPIRRGALLYNIFDTRTEGLATALEEVAMQEGLVSGRARELVYILVAQRAARALGDLKMHANQLSLEGAARFAAEHTPRGWLRLDGQTVWFEQFLYLTQPAYGTSYLIGKIEFDKLITERKRALGDRFTMREVMAEVVRAGLIPMPLVRSEVLHATATSGAAGR